MPERIISINRAPVLTLWAAIFGDDLERVRSAMQKLAGTFSPQQLAVEAYPLYEQFRPEIPAGEKGWGAKGHLDLGVVEGMAKRR